LAEPDEDDVLELTDRVEDEPEPASEPMSVDDDLMILDREDEEPEPAPAPTPSPAPQPVAEEEDNLVDDVPASAASGMFAALSENLRVSSDQGQTLEGIVRELLRPMLKQWLDENLPTIVEEKVQAEIERIARRRR
jgi:cell pole-organizing protein PopZ